MNEVQCDANKQTHRRVKTLPPFNCIYNGNGNDTENLVPSAYAIISPSTRSENLLRCFAQISHARLVIAAVHLALTDRCSPCRWPNNSSGHQNKAWWTFKYSGGAKQMLGGHEIEGTYPVEYRPEESEQAILRAKLNRQLLQAGL